MSHDLADNKNTGRLAYFGVGDSAWHREGFTVDTPPSYEEAARLGGYDYDVRVVPMYTKIDLPMKEGLGEYKQTERGMAIMRTDTWTVLGTASDAYSPLLNMDAFLPAVPLLDKGVATIETGGTLKDGRDAWLLLRFKVDDPVVQEVFTDEIVPFALFTNNHTGARRAICMETPIRVVCANTLGFAIQGMSRDRAIFVVHRGDAKVKMLEAAERLFGGLVERYHTIAEHYRTLKQTIITVEQFTKAVLDTLAPLPADGDEFARVKAVMSKRGFDTMMNRALDRRAALTNLWIGGKGHTGDGSSWEAYNGAVEAIDHDNELFPVRGSRVEALAFGRLVDKKEKVLRNLVALSQ